MTPQEWAERTAQAQDLPPRIQDPAVLRRIAVLGDLRKEARRGA